MTATRQVALVTGASSGIGKAAAIALAGAGFEVIGTARNTARVTAPAGVTYLDLDVTSDESVASVVKQVIDRFGRIDILVNNAGIGANGAFYAHFDSKDDLVATTVAPNCTHNAKA